MCAPKTCCHRGVRELAGAMPVGHANCEKHCNINHVPKRAACADETRRRKKCDETQPSCSVCTTRTIACHGYSFERPQWMDGSVLQKRELDRVQAVVKENRHLQGRIRRQQMEAEARRDNLASRSIPLLMVLWWVRKWSSILDSGVLFMRRGELESFLLTSRHKKSCGHGHDIQRD